MSRGKRNSAGKQVPSSRDSKAKKPSHSPGVGEVTVPLTAELEEKIAGLTGVNRQLKRKIFDLYTIFEISRNFNSVLDYHLLLDTFIYTSMAQVGASKAAIYLEQRRHDGRYVFTLGKGSGDFPGEQLALKEDSELVRYVTKLNRPTATGDLIKNTADTTERKILKSFDPGLAVPLIYETRLSGILLIGDKMSGRSFGMDDIEFLSILGSQISVAIENTRLYEAERTATKQLRAAQQQLVQSERLAALGDMSAKVAHEINNPLGIIKNYLLLIRRAIDDNGEARNYAETVGQEIDRIARIVKELLDFHRPKGVQFERVDVARVMNDVLMLMELQLKSKKVQLVEHYDAGCPMIDASPENLKQVFLNIIINALDVMGEGGILEVDIDRDGENVLIAFCDTGPGIPPEISPRIFEPFFTTKEPGQGTGLGLSVCYGLVKKHNGTITFRNIDSGGCFEIRLPIERRAAKI